VQISAALDFRDFEAPREKIWREKVMKFKNGASLVLIFGLIGATLACKSSSGASINESGNVKSPASAENSTLAETNKKAAAPEPENCPSPAQTFTANDLKDDKIENYIGCTLQVMGRLQRVESAYVVLLDETSSKTIECHGDFFSDTYTKIGEKLDDLRVKGNVYLPKVKFSGKVKRFDNPSTYVGLSDCQMTDYLK
jgi:hypothetical protein